MLWYPCIREGQQSHKYAITSPVEPMNSLLKGPNESLPNNGKMRWYCQVYRLQIIEKHIDSIKWKNALIPPYTILLINSIQFQ